MYLHIDTETDGWNGKPNRGNVSQRLMLITATTTMTRGGVWGWQVGWPPQAPHFRPKVVLMSFSSYILQ